MCEQLGRIRQAIAAYSDVFEAPLLTMAEARMVLRDVSAIEHMAGAMKAMVAARICCADQRPGSQRLAAEQLAELTGTTLGAANDTIAVGRRLQEQPEVAAAAKAGELSPPQLTAVTDGVAANPDAVSRLLDKAANGSLAELRDESARVKAAAQPDPDRRRAEIRAGRNFRSWTDAGGVGHVSAAGNVEDIAEITAAVRGLADSIFHAARLTGERESSQAYEFDALVQLAMAASSPTHPPSPTETGDTAPGTDSPRGGPSPTQSDSIPAGPADDRVRAPKSTRTEGGSSSPTSASSPAPGDAPGGNRKRRQRRGAQVKLLLRVDLDAFLRGYPLDGEMCELDGCGPVPMAAVHDLLSKGDPLVAAILTRGKTVFGVAHLRRQATAHQKTALEWLYPSCNVRGCNCRAHLEIDHRIDWAHGRYTALDILDCLCRFHHARKTREGWALVEGAGKRAFVAPDDPRHPRHHQGGRKPAPRSER